MGGNPQHGRKSDLLSLLGPQMETGRDLKSRPLFFGRSGHAQAGANFNYIIQSAILSIGILAKSNCVKILKFVQNNN